MLVVFRDLGSNGLRAADRHLRLPDFADYSVRTVVGRGDIFCSLPPSSSLILSSLLTVAVWMGLSNWLSLIQPCNVLVRRDRIKALVVVGNGA